MDISKLSRDFSKEPLNPGERPLKEDIEYLLLELNQTRDELASYFGRSLSQVKRWIHDYEIKKPRSLKGEAIRKGTLAKYGVENVSQLQEIKNKKEKKSIEKYGTKNVFQADEIKKKIKQTNIKKFGCDNAAKNKNVYKKIIETNLKKYGFLNPAQNPEIKNKIIQTCLDKYQRSNYQLTHYSNYALSILNTKENLEDFIKTQEHKTIKYLASKLDISTSGFGKWVKKYNLSHLIDLYTSSYELELQSLFPDTFIKTRSVIPPYEIDLYDEEHKFGIEFNGDYWHSELKLPINYHQKKSLVAEEKGIFLYHIWEHEWQDSLKREIILSQIKNILGKNDRRIYARECYVQEIKTEDARKFLEENHLQGYSSASISLGLFYSTELLSIMTFGKPRFNSNYEWELVRYCCKKDTNVLGGSSKLFKHFIREYEPKSILSYSLIAKARGTMYNALGFKLEKISDPEYIWCDGEIVLSRYQCQKHKLLKLGFEGSTEREIMGNLGFFRVFGCGSKVWAWAPSTLN